MKSTDKPIIIEHIFDSPVEVIWKALTELDQMHQWFFENIKEFKLTAGFETQFLIKSETRDFLHLWEIKEVMPPHKLVVNWKFEGYEGEADVIFQLSESNNKTKLRLVNKVIRSFPQDIPEFTRESCIGGWNFFIKQNLKNYIDNKSKNVS